MFTPSQSILHTDPPATWPHITHVHQSDGGIYTSFLQSSGFFRLYTCLIEIGRYLEHSHLFPSIFNVSFIATRDYIGCRRRPRSSAATSARPAASRDSSPSTRARPYPLNSPITARRRCVMCDRVYCACTPEKNTWRGSGRVLMVMVCLWLAAWICVADFILNLLVRRSSSSLRQTLTHPPTHSLTHTRAGDQPEEKGRPASSAA